MVSSKVHFDKHRIIQFGRHLRLFVEFFRRNFLTKGKPKKRKLEVLWKVMRMTVKLVYINIEISILVGS